MSNNQSEFKQFSPLSTNILLKQKPKEFNPINLIALLLLFISLLFLITLSIILNIQNNSIKKLDEEYDSISLSSKNISSQMSVNKQSIANQCYLLDMIGREIKNILRKHEKYTTEYNHLKRTNNLLTKSKLKSKIIKKEESIIITKMINEANPPMLKMIYQASSIDKGDAASVFHEHCKGVGPFVALLKIEKNIRIGGYSSVVMQGSQGSFEDEKAFLFNFDDNEKYMISNPDRALSYNHLLFMNFGASDLFITDEFFSNRFSYTNFPNAYGNPEDITMKNKLTKGQTLFKVLEFELYQVIYLSTG